MPDPERIQSARAAEITGLSIRTVQYLASGGKVPGAAMLGGRWTFDPDQLRRWIKDQEVKATCRPISTSAAPSGGAAFKPVGPSIDEVYERLIGRKPSGASRSSRRNSPQPSTSASRG